MMPPQDPPPAFDKVLEEACNKASRLVLARLKAFHQMDPEVASKEEVACREIMRGTLKDISRVMERGLCKAFADQAAMAAMNATAISQAWGVRYVVVEQNLLQRAAMDAANRPSEET